MVCISLQHSDFHIIQSVQFADFTASFPLHGRACLWSQSLKLIPVTVRGQLYKKNQ